MDPCLIQQIHVDLPRWRKYSQAPKIRGYSSITSLTPAIEKFMGKMPDSEGQIQSDELFARIVDEYPTPSGGSCVIETVSKKKRNAYCKVSHLLDPIRTIQEYYTHPEKGERRKNEKLQNPTNQAFIDCMANYLLGQLRERKVSPHFCVFYGGFQGVADLYRYNITEEFDSYCRYKSFWERRRNGLFTLYTDDSEFQCQTPSSATSSDFGYSTTDSESYKSLDCDVAVPNITELESVNSFESAKSESTYEDEEEQENIYIQLKNHPVMLIFQEEMEGVMDSLLEEEDDEKKWTAWTFQVIAALCAAQGVLGFTHNDLHTNNIVWKTTEESWIFYKTRDGTIWRVPTYGKIFCIIDFGRAIFRLKDDWYISDDYKVGGDADGQYNFDNITREGKLIYPNPSFDLSRYSVSIIEALFPEMPTEILDGKILSKEDWEVHETESPLWNLLWSWLIDDDGKNILQNQDGSERFPDFDLYNHISQHVHCAKPQEQIFKDIFSSYKVKEVGDWETVYPLFC